MAVISREGIRSNWNYFFSRITRSWHCDLKKRITNTPGAKKWGSPSKTNRMLSLARDSSRKDAQNDQPFCHSEGALATEESLAQFIR
jgi:hypothetical protein